MQATLRKADEALSPRALRRVLTALQSVIDPRVSEVEGGRRAHAIALEYAAATPEERRDYWALMSEHFAADPQKLKSARDQHQAAVGTPDEGQAELRLRRALVSPRMRLLQRFAVEPEGMRFLVDLRAELLPFLKSDKRLIALDAELEHLFSTWFDVAFLELRRIDWDSPASLIEKLIRYEAVHDIKSWTDVKNRLDDSDRRCYGFFHPRLPNEPLIFVEVALVDRISDGIMPLLDETAVPIQPAKATTAIFYSISNTQNGLRGVSFGDSLIKRVVETLQDELPRLKTFATLSPIPGFRAWLAKNAAELLPRLDEKREAELGRLVGSLPPTAERLLAAVDGAATLDAKSPLRQWLLQAAAEYLGRTLIDGTPADPRGPLSPGQRCPGRAPQLGRRSVAQGAKAIVWPHGQLPLRSQAARQASRMAGRRQGGGFGRCRRPVLQKRLRVLKESPAREAPAAACRGIPQRQEMTDDSGFSTTRRAAPGRSRCSRSVRRCACAGG